MGWVRAIKLNLVIYISEIFNQPVVSDETQVLPKVISSSDAQDPGRPSNL